MKLPLHEWEDMRFSSCLPQLFFPLWQEDIHAPLSSLVPESSIVLVHIISDCFAASVLSPIHRQQFLMKCYEWLWSSDCNPALFIIMGFGCVAGPLLCPAVVTSVSAFKAGNAVLGSLSVTIAELPYLQDKNPTHC